MKAKKVSVSYHLSGYKGKKIERPIIAYVHFNNYGEGYKPVTFSTGITINPHYFKEGKALHPFEYRNYQLDQLTEIIEAKFKEHNYETQIKTENFTTET